MIKTVPSEGQRRGSFQCLNVRQIYLGRRGRLKDKRNKERRWKTNIRKKLFHGEFQRVSSSRLTIDMATFYSGLLSLASRKFIRVKLQSKT
jgi:hypothetical protein